MLSRIIGRLATCAIPLVVAVAPIAASAQVSVRFNFNSVDGSPFPSDRFTVPDFSQITFRRVNLPQPNCQMQPSECQDIQVLNALDGFSTQPRITVPFTGPINPATVNSQTVFLVNMGDVQTGAGVGQRIGINQIVWHPATNTLSFESDRLLAQHSRYALVVTTAVRDAQNAPLQGSGFTQILRNSAAFLAANPNLAEYWKLLFQASQSASLSLSSVAALSVFTTQSITADLEKINRQLRNTKTQPVSFMVGNGGSVRAVFPISTISDLRLDRQVSTAPGFAPQPVPFSALNTAPGAVGVLAYGSFRSPEYRNAAGVIPAVPTLSGQPAIQRWNTLRFQLHLPAGAKPKDGWPVAIFGHGFTDSLYGESWAVAGKLAERGIATLAIQVVGHGGGEQGMLTVLRPNAPSVAIPAGGRGVDVNGDGSIDPAEGLAAAPPLDSRDGLRQTVIDLMQLVRNVEAGIDVDGDGKGDLNPNRLYYAGQSLGAIYGTPFVAVEPRIRAALINVGGGSFIDVARLSIYRPLLGLALAYRQPTLINVQDPTGIAFNENLPLRNQPPLIDTVPGAEAIQKTLDRFEWAEQSANPVAYAKFLRKSPLPGRAARPVIVQFAKGDMNVPNPTNSALIRAGDLTDRSTYYRHDLAYPSDPSLGSDPHTFLTNVFVASAVPLALQAQTQMSTFFATNGGTTLDPDGSGPLFETPIAGALPETLNFLP